MATATSALLSKALTNFGKKIRSKVAKHIVRNNMVAKKDLLNPFKKRLKTSRRDSLNHENIDPIEEVEEDKSESNDRGQTLSRARKMDSDLRGGSVSPPKPSQISPQKDRDDAPEQESEVPPQKGSEEMISESPDPVVKDSQMESKEDGKKGKKDVFVDKKS